MTQPDRSAAVENDTSSQPRPRKPSRRRFLLGGLGAFGALIVGWGFLPPRQRLQSSIPMTRKNGEAQLNGWLKIGADGIVTLAMPRSEMGQGVHTSLAMLAAEELDVPLAMMRVETAPHDSIYGNLVTLPDGLPFHPDDDGMLKSSVQWLTVKLSRELGLQITGGSSSVRDAWLPIRQAGASARAMLVAAAARQWGVAPAECTTGDGMVRFGRGNAVQSLSYGALAAKALAEGAPSSVALKQPGQFKLIGTQAPRTDSADKSSGKAVFGIDVRPAGLQYAAVLMSPTVGGKIARIDDSAAIKLPGVLRIVDFSRDVGELGAAGVAVIGLTYWQARMGAAALKITWDAGPNAAVDSAAVAAQLKDALDTKNAYVYYERGEISQPA
ncbi:MAG TPA: molybdopterin cofactor-binding domain-containing protein, partial [Burkholderiaceae bacterium]